MSIIESITMVFGVFGSATLVIFIIAKYSYLTKKAMYEKGIAAEGVRNRVHFFDIACIIIGVGIGLGLSAILPAFDLPEESEELLIYACTLIFGGLGMVFSYLNRKRFE